MKVEAEHAKPTMRRALIQISAQLLVDMSKAGPPKVLQVLENPLPQDARAVGGRYDSIRDVFELAIESEVFDDIPETKLLPLLPPSVFGELYR